MKDDDYRELYFHEWHRRDQVSAYTNLPMTVSTALVGGLFYLFKTFPDPLRLDFFTVIFWACFLRAGWFLGRCIYWLGKSVHGYDYERIPNLEALHELKLEYLAQQSKLGKAGGGTPESRTEEYLTDFWQKRLAKAQAHNAANNKSKLGFLDKAMGALISTIALTAITTVPYFVSALMHGSTAKSAVEEPSVSGVSAMEYPDFQIDVAPGPGEGPPPPPLEPDNDHTRDLSGPSKIELGGDNQSPQIPKPTDLPPAPVEPDNDRTADFPLNPIEASGGEGEGEAAPNDPPAPAPTEPDNDFTKNEKPPLETK